MSTTRILPGNNNPKLEGALHNTIAKSVLTLGTNVGDVMRLKLLCEIIESSALDQHEMNVLLRAISEREEELKNLETTHHVEPGCIQILRDLIGSFGTQRIEQDQVREAA